MYGCCATNDARCRDSWHWIRTVDQCFKETTIPGAISLAVCWQCLDHCEAFRSHSPRWVDVVLLLLWQLICVFSVVMLDWAEKYGDVLECSIGPFDRIVLVSNGKKTREILNQVYVFLKGVTEEAEIILGLPASMAVIDGESWHHQRAALAPLSTSTMMRMQVGTVVKVVERVKAKWIRAASEECEVDVMEDMKCMTVDATVLITMGWSLNSSETEEGAQLQHDEH